MKIIIEEVRQVELDVPDDNSTHEDLVKEAIDKGLVTAYSKPVYYNYEAIEGDWKTIPLRGEDANNNLVCIDSAEQSVVPLRIVIHPDINNAEDADYVSDVTHCLDRVKECPELLDDNIPYDFDVLED